MSAILLAVTSVTIIGMVCAVALAVASKVMAVATDEREELILACLPGANCGACGFSGCAGYARALASGDEAKNNLCAPGGAGAAKGISAVLGVDADDAPRMVAVIRCGRDRVNAGKKMDYKGIPSCAAAKLLYGGELACAFACLSFGDCLSVCPSGAICMENGLARINPNLCSGCGLCAKACPNQVIAIVESGRKAVVACGNIEKGALVRRKCEAGCIACGLCVRECPRGAIVLKDNLAVIDYKKCANCGHCADVCAVKCVRPPIPA